MDRILAATDLSARGEHAVARGAELAARLGAELVLLHAVDDELPAAVRAAQTTQAEDLLQTTAAKIGGETGARVRVRVEPGLDFQVIAAVAEAEAADLVVVGPHRRSLLRDLFIGTTVERLLRSAAVPVLVARDGEAKPYVRVLAAVDLVEEAATVLALSARLAAAGPLHVAHVRIDPIDAQVQTFGTDPETIAEHRKETELRVREALARLALRAGAGTVLPTVLHGGPVVPRLLEVVQDLQVDLVALGTTTQARSGLQRWLQASQAEQALIEARIDVLCVPLAAATPLAGVATVP